MNRGFVTSGSIRDGVVSDKLARDQQGGLSNSPQPIEFGARDGFIHTDSFRGVGTPTMAEAGVASSGPGGSPEFAAVPDPAAAIGAIPVPPVAGIAPLLSLATAFALPIVRDLLMFERALATLILSMDDYATVREHADELADHVRAIAIAFSQDFDGLMEACVAHIEETR